jgi:hypothetical protein
MVLPARHRLRAASSAVLLLGTTNDDVLANFDPSFRRTDMVDLIENSPWPE